MKVTFCGHREILWELEIKAKLEQAVEGCIKLGADKFLLGGLGG